MAHITNNCSSKRFGRSDFFGAEVFPSVLCGGREGVQFWWVSTWCPGPSVSIGCVTQAPYVDLFDKTLSFQKKGYTELMCAMPVSGANHLLIAIIHGGFAVPHDALPYFTKRLPFIQKCPIQPVDKQVVSSFSRGLDFTLETNQAVNWHKALPLPKM